MKEELCGCCEGLEKLTPMVIANRPGLNALAYRVGTHATFLETMKARLTDHFLEVPTSELDEHGRPKTVRIRPLSGLTTREGDDPSIALLNAWATVADVLTFYQERIANEGYLRTATERRSILELARLVGYRLRPGVAASVYLAFTLEKGYKGEIPAGTRAQSLPGPGELPQSFETSKPLEARAEWNALKPRMSRPQLIRKGNATAVPTVYLDGTATNLAPNDPLLLSFGPESTDQVFRRVKSVDVKTAEGRTDVTLQETPAASTDAMAVTAPQVRRIVDRYLDLEKHDVASTAMAKRVAKELESLKERLPDDAAVAEIRSAVDGVLEKLRPEHKTALKGGFTKLEPWLKGLITDLEQAVAEGGAAVAPIDIAEWPIPSDEDEKEVGELPQPVGLGDLIPTLVKPPSLQPTNALRLPRSIERVFAPQSDTGPRLLTTLRPQLRRTLYKAWANAKVTKAPPLESIEALRVKAAPFGHNAPLKPIYDAEGRIVSYEEWVLAEAVSTSVGTPVLVETLALVLPEQRRRIVFLDAEYDQIIPESWVVIERPAWNQPRVFKVMGVRTVSKAAYSISRKVTQLTLDRAWLDENDTRLSVLREVTIYAQGEELTPAEEPVRSDVAGDTIELDGLYDRLESGRWLIVSGERTDIPGTSGVRTSELVMMAGVTQGVQKISLGDMITVDRPSDTIHTTIHFANDLAYKYKRDTVTIYGNVVKATHGETREEVLGSGDGSKALQQFALKQSPLTYLAASTPAGAESTLKVRVNDVLWHEKDRLVGLGPNDRVYITHTDNEDKTGITFGDGQHGARLPSGVENVKAIYRTGIGKPGNVAAEQISLLATRPLGVKGVINPLRASGGADRESRDQARRNAPLAVMALDRLVSVQDYADFARTYAGIGKASAARLTDGRRQVVHVTIAGADDIPVDETSDLYQNLCQALHQFGDPYQPIQLDVRELMLLVISAKVRLLPDYQWESVEPKIRAALLDAFSFERRDLGQDVLRSEVISAIQAVEGVAFVDLDTFDAVNENITVDELSELADALGLQERITVHMDRVEEVNNERVIKPAQLAFLSPEVPDTLILTELTS